jgi:plastocyanin
VVVALITFDASPGEVAGTVTFDGPPPKLMPIDTKADEYCHKMHADAPLFSDEATIGPNGEFAYIFVYVENPPAGDYPVPSEPLRLNQYGCRYELPVFGMRVGQTIEFVNSDNTTHNVRGFPKFNRVFNFGQPPGLAPRTRAFDKAEMPLKIKCDVHAWMKSHCFVMDHPFFAVTDLEGRYTIGNLPPGTYTVKVWHERLGELHQEVTVGDGSPAEADFTYKRIKKTE